MSKEIKNEFDKLLDRFFLEQKKSLEKSKTQYGDSAILKNWEIFLEKEKEKQNEKFENQEINKEDDDIGKTYVVINDEEKEQEIKERLELKKQYLKSKGINEENIEKLLNENYKKVIIQTESKKQISIITRVDKSESLERLELKKQYLKSKGMSDEDIMKELKK